MMTVELRNLLVAYHGPIKVALATLSLAFLMSVNPAFAQIYKWVDDAGNVHFGDKPQDKNTLKSSEKVELKSNYVPGDGPSAEQIEAGKAFLRKKDMEREQQQLAAEKEAAGQQALQAQCDSMRERLTDFTEAGMRDGKRKRVDYFVEDGKTVSAKRQKEIIAELQNTISKKCA